MKGNQSFTGRKLALSFTLIILSAVYAISQNTGNSSTVVATTDTSTSTTITPVARVTTPTPITTIPVTDPVVATPIPTPVTTPSGQYTDGSYTGSAVDAYYGTVQVKTVVSGGKLTDVQFLQYPKNHSESRMINTRAMPTLTQEAIIAQSAVVSGVSGATFTSKAFKESLAVALANAKS